jgi:hypothetical protein
MSNVIPLQRHVVAVKWEIVAAQESKGTIGTGW